ncbi:MAG TPA: hypothetical protein PLQ36_00770 [Candidatus Gracilibacteria bacterium]|nr:hypothetical protein [Candidatus Gracilibacteria bacterium]
MVCPHCNKNIPVSALELKESNDQSCTFEATCEFCHNTVGISAVIETQLSSEGQKMNSSSRLSQREKELGKIQYAEASILKQTLENFSSFKNIFKS